MGDEIEQKERVNSLKNEKKASNEMPTVSPDVCDTPSLPSSISIPYPNTAKASDTSSGPKTVRTEGKMLPVKEDFEKSVGDEAGTSDDKSEAGFLKELAKPKVLGIPMWIWGLLIIAVIIVLWLLSSNSPVPIETLE